MVYRHLLVSHVVAFPSVFGEKRPRVQNALKVVVGAVGGARRRVPVSRSIQQSFAFTYIHVYVYPLSACTRTRSGIIYYRCEPFGIPRCTVPIIARILSSSVCPTNVYMATQRAEQFNSNGKKNIKKINKQEKNSGTADLAIPLTDAFSLPPSTPFRTPTYCARLLLSNELFSCTSEIISTAKRKVKADKRF